uniref:Uncharacterized protein n=1 Tax=Amphimedon queenslandica TaxID=400682 RepID=A0A1X7UNT3_AMPQE
VQIAINTCNQNLKELLKKKLKLVYKSLASVLSINPLDISSLFQLYLSMIILKSLHKLTVIIVIFRLVCSALSITSSSNH